MSGKLLAISDQPLAGEGTTMRLYRPLEDLGIAHQQAFMNLSQAVAKGDEVAMKEAFDAVTYFEQRQREAAVEMRKHLLEKAREGEVQRGKGAKGAEAVRDV